MDELLQQVENERPCIFPDAFYIVERNNGCYNTNNPDSNRSNRSSGRDPVPLKTRSVIGERNSG